MAKSLAENLQGEVSSRIVTMYDEEDEPWAEIRVEFVDGEPKQIKAKVGGTLATKDWKNDEFSLSSMEDVLSEIQNFIPVRLKWIGQ